MYAAADVDDEHHRACVDLLEGHPGPLIVPALCVSEAAYFISTRLGPEAETRFVADLAGRNLVAEPVGEQDWWRIAELVWDYRNLPLGTVDASVVAVAERLQLVTIATLDRRDFAVVRPRHTEAFELKP